MSLFVFFPSFLVVNVVVAATLDPLLVCARVILYIPRRHLLLLGAL